VRGDAQPAVRARSADIRADQITTRHQLVDNTRRRRICEVRVTDGAVTVRVRVGADLETRTFHPADRVKVTAR
jgi:hypothetical protein